MSEKPWWGAINIPKNSSLLFDSQTFTLAVEHKIQEWCIHLKRNKQLEDDTNENAFSLSVGEFIPVDFTLMSRHIAPVETDVLDIKPSLADRTVVCRPKSPINILPGASVIIFLSTPVWLAVSVKGRQPILLKEIATQQLSDTWFGSSTLEGELCYASQTIGWLDIDQLPSSLLQVLTSLKIENKADSDLIFERIALPVTSLSLYVTDQGQLWTQNVGLIRENDGYYAKLKLGNAKANTRLISGPRVESGHGKLIHAFSAIFS
jgi:hypothetical protein